MINAERAGAAVIFGLYHRADLRRFGDDGGATLNLKAHASCRQTCIKSY